MLEVASDLFGVLDDGTDVWRYTFGDRDGVELSMITYGACVHTLVVPDRDARRDNVVLGCPDLAGYVSQSPYFGTTVGRFANRIGRGRFTLEGKQIQLSVNDHGNTLHGGGDANFSHRVWAADPIDDGSQVGVRFTLHSRDGDNGFPGAVDVVATYVVDDTGLVTIHFAATTDAVTVVNLTNHSYFNLAGEAAGSVLDHVLQVDADRYVPVDPQSIPLGRIDRVDGTPLDFRSATRIGASIAADHQELPNGDGYDIGLVFAAGARRGFRLTDPASGRTLTGHTDQPSVQLYTSNKLDGTVRGTSGRYYQKFDAVALETQHLADSPNHPDFPSTVLHPGERFETTTTWRFGIT